MARKKSKKRKPAKQRNSWYGEKERHSKARRTGVAGGPYKTKVRKESAYKSAGKLANPKKRRARKHRNPAGGATEIGMTFLLGISSFFINKIIGNFALKGWDLMFANPDPNAMTAKIRPFVKPVSEMILPAATLFFGHKVTNNGAYRTAVFTGSSIAAGHDLLKAVLPDNIYGYLADLTDENTETIPGSVFDEARYIAENMPEVSVDDVEMKQLSDMTVRELSDVTMQPLEDVTIQPLAGHYRV